MISNVSDVTFGERQIQHLNLVYIHSLLLLLFVLCSSADYHCYCLHVLKEVYYYPVPFTAIGVSLLPL